jgi:acyl-CoA thioesterase-1
MKRLPALLATAWIFSVASGSCADPAPAREGPRTVIVFGDSITAGSALPKEEKSHLWVTLVQKESGGRLKVTNEGKGGRPTDSLKEFEAMLNRQPKPDLLVVALGTNDSRDISDACVPKAVEHLSAIVRRAREKYRTDLPVLIVGPPNINKEALGPTKPIANERDGKLKDLGAAYAKLAEELHCGFVSLYGVIPTSSLMRDGVHPDAAGNEEIAKTLLPKLLAAP